VWCGCGVGVVSVWCGHTTPTPHFLKKVVVLVWCGVIVVLVWCRCGLGEGCQLCANVNMSLNPEKKTNKAQNLLKS